MHNFCKCCSYRQLQDSNKSYDSAAAGAEIWNVERDEYNELYTAVSRRSNRIFICNSLPRIYSVYSYILYARIILVFYLRIYQYYAYIYIRYYDYGCQRGGIYIYTYSHITLRAVGTILPAPHYYIYYSSNCTHFISVLRLPNLLS